MTLELREFCPGDEPALLAALAAACRRAGAAAPDRAQWSWTCERNPAGRRIFLALEGARVLAHCAALPQRVWLAGREAIFAELRGGFGPPLVALQKEGPFVRSARALAEHFGASGGDLVHHGYPSPGEERVWNGLLDFEVVRDQHLLVRDCGPGARELPPGVERLARFDHQAKWLWDRCADGFGASAIRDDTFLNWRFVERPAVRYERLGVRDAGGVLRGYGIYRSGEWAGRRSALVVDWLVPPAEHGVGELLLEGLLALARLDGERTLAALFPGWSPWFERFQRAGFLVEASRARLLARCFARKYDETWLREHWWTTLADTTLV